MPDVTTAKLSDQPSELPCPPLVSPRPGEWLDPRDVQSVAVDKLDSEGTAQRRRVRIVIRGGNPSPFWQDFPTEEEAIGFADWLGAEFNAARRSQWPR